VILPTMNMIPVQCRYVNKGPCAKGRQSQGLATLFPKLFAPSCVQAFGYVDLTVTDFVTALLLAAQLQQCRRRRTVAALLHAGALVDPS